MDCIGFDPGKVASQICVITEEGELIERRLKSGRESLSQLFGGRSPARVFREVLAWLAEDPEMKRDTTH